MRFGRRSTRRTACTAAAMRHGRSSSLFAVGFLLAFAACEYPDETESRRGTPPPAADAPAAVGSDDACSATMGRSPMRRLTRVEYDNTIQDLLGDASKPAETFPEEEVSLGFDDNADALTVSPLLARGYMVASEQIAARAVAKLPTLLGCDPQKDGSDACAKSFIASFGKRAYRRPVDAALADALFRTFSAGRDAFGFEVGIQLTLQQMLQSPYFLYRVETGIPVTGQPGVAKLDDWEIASRLSYLLWDSMPDDELFAAAADGKLSTKADVAAQARRMLASPRARDAVARFHVQWLDVTDPPEDKDRTAFPTWSPAIAALLQEETRQFTTRLVLDDDGDLAALLGAPYSYMNADLAKFYGVTGPAGRDFEKIALDGAHRNGVLTQGSVLAVHAHPDQTSPVLRGKFVREQLLCGRLPPPPPNVATNIPTPDPHLTTRERFDQHRKDPACAGCHDLMDPIGYGLETFDAAGLFRTTESGKPIDASGEVTGSDVGAFRDAADLAKKLGASEDVRACVATQWFRYAYGREESDADACSRDALEAAFAASGYRIRELVVALTQTAAFRYVRAGAPEDSATTGGAP